MKHREPEEMPEDFGGSRRAVAVFVLITFLTSLLLAVPRMAFAVLALLGRTGYTALFMWFPGMAAAFTLAWRHRPLTKLRLDRPPVAWSILGVALPLLYALPIYVLAWASGLAPRHPTFVPNWPLLLTMGLGRGVALALGEELGWRGFLVPELTTLTGFTRGALLSGLIWGVWHYPAILLGRYNAGQGPAYTLVCFTVGIVGNGVAMAWLRLASNSVWPSTLAHGVHNVLVQEVLDRMTLRTPWTGLVTTEFGVGMALAGAVLALVFLWLGDPRPAEAAGVPADAPV